MAGSIVRANCRSEMIVHYGQVLGGLGGLFLSAVDACLGNAMGQGVLGGFGLGL